MAFCGYSEPGLRGETCGERYRKWQSVATRFYRWQKADIWQQVLERLQADADQLRKLDCPVHYVDGTVIRAHQHAAGGKKGAK